MSSMRQKAFSDGLFQDKSRMSESEKVKFALLTKSKIDWLSGNYISIKILCI
jgi:hypothetical protein